MSKEAASERAAYEQPLQPSVSSVPSVPVQPQGGSVPKGLLQQMEELMAALTADLSQLDADFQSAADRQATADATDGTTDAAAREPDRPDGASG